MSRYHLTPGRDTFLAPGNSIIVAGTDTLTHGDIIVAAPGGLDALVLQDGNRFDLSAPAVLAGIDVVQDDAVGDSVITLRDGLDLVLHLGQDNATVHGADNADRIIGGPSGGYATIVLGSARESVVAGRAGATVFMTTAEAGARIDGRDVTTVQLTGRYGDAARLGAELRGVAELDVLGGGFSLSLADAGIAAVALSSSGIDVAVGAATHLVTDYAGGNTIRFSGAGQTLRLPEAGTAALPPDHLVGMAAGDAIDIDLPYSASEHLDYNQADGTLTLTDTRSGASATVMLDHGGPASFQLSPDAGLPSGDTGTLITFMGAAPAGGGGASGEASCFAAGTRLLSSRGPIAVERLAVGDRLVTQTGAARPIRWIGHRRIDCSRHRSPDLVLPIRVSAGAFAESVPMADVLLSPDHALYVDGALIPVKYLVNGATIRRETVRSVRYFHVELETHDVVLAEALPVESYLDTGNRHQFTNAGAVTLHPDLAAGAWPDHACAPLVTGGPKLRAARAMLMARADAQGFDATSDSDLHLLADGHRIWGQVNRGIWSGWVPPGVADLRIVSRAAAPADCTLDSDDRRTLGVALSRIGLRAARGMRIVTVDEPVWGSGFHPPEQDAASRWRWTTGCGVLNPALWRELEGPLRVELHLCGAIAYRRAPPAMARPARRLSRRAG